MTSENNVLCVCRFVCVGGGRWLISRGNVFLFSVLDNKEQESVQRKGASSKKNREKYEEDEEGEDEDEETAADRRRKYKRRRMKDGGLDISESDGEGCKSRKNRANQITKDGDEEDGDKKRKDKKKGKKKKKKDKKKKGSG